MGLSQNNIAKIDSIIELEIKRLKNDKFTKIGYTKLTCVGYGIFNTVYLFYAKDDSTFIQKFKNSEYENNSLIKFKPLKIKDSVFFPFYLTHRIDLNNEIVRHFAYKVDSTGGNSVQSGRIMTSHGCHRHFVVRTNNENFYEEFDFFDLKEFDMEKTQAGKMTEEEVKQLSDLGWKVEDDSIYENYPKKNINFDFNQKQKIVKWNKILSGFIDRLESERVFKKIKSE